MGMELVSIIALYASISASLSLPPGLLQAVCYVESNHALKAYTSNDGGTPSVGLCQVKETTAKMLGFVGTEKELRIPSNNIYYAGKYLKYNIDRYEGSLHKGVSAYNLGRYKERSPGIPKNSRYVHKVFSAWLEGL